MIVNKIGRLIDSSVWLDYLFNGNHKKIIDSEEILLISVLSIFEIKKKLLKEKIGKHQISNGLEFIKKRSLVIPLTLEICEKAVDISLTRNIPTIDSLIYLTALTNDAVVLTLDNDFRGLEGAEIL